MSFYQPICATQNRFMCVAKCRQNSTNIAIEIITWNKSNFLSQFIVQYFILLIELCHKVIDVLNTVFNVNLL